MMYETAEKFWLVWNENTGHARHRHYSKKSAVKEAERLCQAHPGQRFYVLKAVDAVLSEVLDPIHEPLMKPPSDWRLVSDDEIPF